MEKFSWQTSHLTEEQLANFSSADNNNKMMTLLSISHLNCGEARRLEEGVAAVIEESQEEMEGWLRAVAGCFTASLRQNFPRHLDELTQTLVESRHLPLECVISGESPSPPVAAPEHFILRRDSRSQLLRQSLLRKAGEVSGKTPHSHAVPIKMRSSGKKTQLSGTPGSGTTTGVGGSAGFLPRATSVFSMAGARSTSLINKSGGVKFVELTPDLCVSHKKRRKADVHQEAPSQAATLQETEIKLERRRQEKTTSSGGVPDYAAALNNSPDGTPELWTNPPSIFDQPAQHLGVEPTTGPGALHSTAPGSLHSTVTGSLHPTVSGSLHSAASGSQHLYDIPTGPAAVLPPFHHTGELAYADVRQPSPHTAPLRLNPQQLAGVEALFAESPRLSKEGRDIVLRFLAGQPSIGDAQTLLLREDLVNSSRLQTFLTMDPRSGVMSKKQQYV